jgi:hypothetical protein
MEKLFVDLVQICGNRKKARWRTRTWTTIPLVVAANQNSCEFRVSRSYDYIANNLGPSVHFQLASYPRAIVEIISSNSSWTVEVPAVSWKQKRRQHSGSVRCRQSMGPNQWLLGFSFWVWGWCSAFCAMKTGNLERAVELQSRVHWFFQRYTLNLRLTTENEGNLEDNMFSSGWTAVLTHPCFLLTLGEISGQRSAVPDSTSLCRNSFFSPSRTQWPLKILKRARTCRKKIWSNQIKSI